MTTKEKIEKILRAKISIDHLDLIDESFKHAGHNESARSGGTHMQLLIVSNDFKGKTLIQRHKLIYKILESEFESGLHALAIKALTPQESKS